jgi:ABC-type sugar transport system permease subunit
MLDEYFARALVNNFLLFLIIPLMTLFSLLVSFILYQQIAGWKIYRATLFLPYITSITALGVVFTHILRKAGVLNYFLSSIGLGVLALDWLGDPKIALGTVAVIIFWKQVGFGIVLLLARLMSINNELFEAAMIDGANWWQELTRIAVPQMRTVIQFYVIITGIYILSWIFDYIYIITYGGPGFSTYVLSYYVYQNTFRFRVVGVGNASSLFLLILGSVFIVAQFYLRRKTIGAE